MQDKSDQQDKTTGSGEEQAPDANMRERFTVATERSGTVKTAGDPEDAVPFAWRFPLQTAGKKKVSKVLKNIADAESERAALVPQENPFED